MYFLTAVYRDGRVYIANKSYAAGVYAVHLLNQYYKNDTAARIAVYKKYILQVRRQLEIGYLNESDFEKAGEETQGILKTLPKLKPFDTLDVESEKKRISRTVLYNALYAAYDQLTYHEQRTLAKHLGFCDSCWSTKKAILKNGEVEYIPIKPMTFEEISHSASRKSDKASERTFYTALEKMKKHIEENTDYRYIFG